MPATYIKLYLVDKIFSKVTDSEQKSEKVLEKLTKLISNMTQLEDMFSIETPTFILVHKKSNITTLPFNMEFKNNTIQLPDLFNLINNNNQINETKQITLKVYDKIEFELLIIFLIFYKLNLF